MKLQLNLQMKFGKKARQTLTIRQRPKDRSKPRRLLQLQTHPRRMKYKTIRKKRRSR